jgi:hypothetical protein
MGSYIDVVGGSGSAYRFNLAENAKPNTAVAGVYVYVRQPPEQPAALLFIGQADSLLTDAALRWPEAIEKFGATHLYFRLNVARQARQSDMADLLAAYIPPMNA